jgi:hypothetical protein
MGGGVRLPGRVCHDLLMVKFPFPLHPVVPLRVHVPVIVLPFTAPCRASWLFVPVEDAVEMFIPNDPLTLPLKVPLRPNEPVCVVDPEKQEPLVVNLRLVMLIDPPLC